MDFSRKNSDDLSAAFAGIDDTFIDVLYGGERADLLKKVGENITESLNKEKGEEITPSIQNIFRAFLLSPYENTSCVIVGQDPYPKKGDAQGISFSTSADRKIPASLKKIYECADYTGAIKGIPSHPNLINWAKQGVLLLNLTLTTVVGKSNVHKKHWKRYMTAVITEFARRVSEEGKQIIWLLWGNDAAEVAKMVKKAHINSAKSNIIMEWGHPSPLNSANKSDNPKNFKYCDHFISANKILAAQGRREINWDPDAEL